MKAGQELKQLPELASVRTKTMFRSTSDPGLGSHTLPDIRAKRADLDASFEFKLPTMPRANTLPALAPFEQADSSRFLGERRGSEASSATVRIDGMNDTRSTFRVSFQTDNEGSRGATPWLADL